MTHCLLPIACCLLPGCQTERVTTSDGWPLPPPPRQVPAAAPSVKADRMVFTVGSKPDDTNGNGFPDSIKASVALFSSDYPMSLRQAGVFVFTLFRQGESSAAHGGAGGGDGGAQPLGQWRIAADSPKAMAARTIAGPAYLFELSLLEAGAGGGEDGGAGGPRTDVMPLDRADLLCRFEHADGSPSVNCAGVRSIQIGRRGMRP